MEVYHYKTKVPNFGDDLNEVLWKQILPPDILAADIPEKLCGIGTILNDITPPGHYLVLGSGAGYGKKEARPSPDVSLTVFAVRGPLTAEKVGVSSEFAITDGAILIRKLWPDLLDVKPKYRFGYIPHWEQHVLHGDGLRKCCEFIGGRYISPCQDPYSVALQISECKTILAEAMHGAIFADNLRRPWIPIIISKRINQFKWRDWCASIQQPYTPKTIWKLSTVITFANPIRIIIDTGVIVQFFLISRFSKRYLSAKVILSKNERMMELSVQKLIDTVTNLKGTSA